MAPLWNAGNKTTLLKLQRVQNKAIKLIYNFKTDTPTTTVLHTTQLLTLKETVELESIKLIHKIKLREIITKIQPIWNRDINEHNTGHQTICIWHKRKI